MGIVLRVIGKTWEGVETMHAYALDHAPVLDVGVEEGHNYYAKLQALAMNKPSRFCPDFQYVEDVQVRTVARNVMDLYDDGCITTTYDLVRCNWTLPTSRDHWVAMLD